MQRLGVEAENALSSSDDLHTPDENDLLVTRLVARIAELEERLYKKELEAPAIGMRELHNMEPYYTVLLLGSPAGARHPSCGMTSLLPRRQLRPWHPQTP